MKYKNLYFNDDDTLTAIKKNILWIIPIIAIVLWTSFTFDYSSPAPDEARYLYAANVVASGDTTVMAAETNTSRIPLNISAAADSIGGYIGARVLSGIFGILSMIVFFLFSKKLLNDTKGAVFALLLFALQGPRIFISKSAGGEIFALFFLICSMYFLIADYWQKHKKDEVVPVSKQVKDILLGIFFMILAVLCDNALVVYLPVLIILLAVRSPERGLVAAALILVGIGVGMLISPEYSWLMTSSAPDRPIYRILLTAIEYSILPLILVILSFQFPWKVNIPKAGIYTLLILALPVVLMHIVTGNNDGLYKNINYSYVFLLPVAGQLLKEFLQINIDYRRAAIFLTVAAVLLSWNQVDRMENAAPDMTGAVEYIEENMNEESVIFTDNEYLLFYSFYGKLKKDQIKALPDSEGADDRIMENLLDGVYDFVMINGLRRPELAFLMREQLLPHNYIRVWHQDFINSSILRSNSRGTAEVYKVKDVPGQTVYAENK
ncbi:MAG: hypothetical protein PF588_05595 [Candidatus Kapabacteria bacterium]|jgi:hypothetical protein|nr:hypothetical protein [Candidatus Kapabacteria bacterium]